MVRHTDIIKGCAEWDHLLPHIGVADNDDPIRVRWLEHVESCPACAAVLEGERSLAVELQSLPPLRRAHLASEVMHRVRESGAAQPILSKRELRWSLAGAVAGILLGIIVLRPTFFDDAAAMAYSGGEYAYAFDDEIDRAVRELAGLDDGGDR